MRGRIPKPTAIKLAEGNRGKRPLNAHEPTPPRRLPTCPRHLSPTVKTEWKRIAAPMQEAGLLTTVDRAALAAYCQAYGRWVEAERRLAEGPALIRTPSGYVQQSSWMSVANKQMEMMGRYMTELGITPSSRSRIALPEPAPVDPRVISIVRTIVDPKDPEPRQIDRARGGGVYDA